uniref:Bax inhibitor 1-like n=1 Tax=Stomoxys calcitrans TaxID=35570 RepID=A0A1I8NUP3_STOCA
MESPRPFDQLPNTPSEEYEPYVEQHLFKVYLTLCGVSVAAAIGCILFMENQLNMGLFSAMAAGIALMILYCDNGYYTRLSMLYAFGFCAGQTMGPLLRYTAIVDPSIIVNAFGGVAVTFAALSITSLAAGRLRVLFWVSVLICVNNIISLFIEIFGFHPSIWMQVSQMFSRILITAGSVLLYTQNIVDDVRLGYEDVVQHSLDLFFYVLILFRSFLIIKAYGFK